MNPPKRNGLKRENKYLAAFSVNLLSFLSPKISPGFMILTWSKESFFKSLSIKPFVLGYSNLESGLDPTEDIIESLFTPLSKAFLARAIQ